MSLRELIDDLRERHSHHPSLQAQIKVYTAHHWLKTIPGKNGPDLGKRDMDQALDALDLELNCTLNTAVRNLLNADLLGKYEPDGPDWYLIRERDGEFVMGDDFPPAVYDECERAIDHIQSMDPSDEDGTTAVADGGQPPKTNDDGETLREEIAGQVESDPGEVEDWLRVGDAQIRREKLERLVEILEESNTFSVPETFDRIKLLPKGYRYHRSETAIGGS